MRHNFKWKRGEFKLTKSALWLIVFLFAQYYTYFIRNLEQVHIRVFQHFKIGNIFIYANIVLMHGTLINAESASQNYAYKETKFCITIHTHTPTLQLDTGCDASIHNHLSITELPIARKWFQLLT